MLRGLNVFPLGIMGLPRCGVCTVEGIDLTCAPPVKPTMLNGKLTVGIQKNVPFEMYGGQDAILVRCADTCESSESPSIMCQGGLSAANARFHLFSHNGNVYAILKTGREGEMTIVSALISREYDQPELRVSVQVTVRK